MVGSVVSKRLTVKVQVEEFPAASVAVSVMVVEPTPETEEPIAGDCVTTIEAEGVQLSLTVASEV